MKRLLILALIILFSTNAFSQSSIVKEFTPVCDSLTTLLVERTGVQGVLKLKNVKQRGSKLDFYFSESLGDFPFRPGDAEWFRNKLTSLFPRKYRSCKLGLVYTRDNVEVRKLEVAEMSENGYPVKSQNQTSEPRRRKDFVTPLHAQEFEKGLSGRNIVVWHSHGYFYDNGAQRWNWQRPCLFQTVEDVYTQGYVLPFLVPMLENAGAYVMMPRERDIQTNEVIADNDNGCGLRGNAKYEESGRWISLNGGFADLQETYRDFQTPFGMGTARMSACVPYEGSNYHSEVVWRPEIPERGSYAVYISYKSLPESTSAAHYSVHHMGGINEFVVNQKLGGDTWVYLGTFEFAKGSEGFVKLTSTTPKGYRYEKKSVVTADAVRFGGGMGNIARGPVGPDSDVEVSGMPRYIEGARYWLQYAGADVSIFNASGKENDYNDDFMCRGDWVSWISGGSCTNPKQKGKGIPVDLTLGFHSDAGFTPDDSTVGTLSIYTYDSEGKHKLPSGENRLTSREFADIAQSQIVDDIRSEFDPDWNRRQIRNRGYRESRTPSSPSMLLELLSHQNFADMKYGLDPAFRFTVSRAVYKGMLKYMANRYDLTYTVQPLPVSNMSVSLSNDNKAELKWTATVDKQEPTASPKGYILYTRIDDGAFDTGKIITPSASRGTLSYTVNIVPGHIYSFMIQAYNDGGKSFMSETVCVGMPKNKTNLQKKVLIVNNFDRVSGPVFFDTPRYAGFDNSIDSGVPYIRDISYIGEMYQNHRNSEWISNDNPGFGASHQDYAGKTVAGNTFDFAYTHGKAVLEAGYPFYSCSNEAFCSNDSVWKNAWCVDLICGKQVTTVIGSAKNKTRYTVFSDKMQQSLKRFIAARGHVLISGAYIATDIWSSIYEYEKDAEFRKSSIEFAEEVLGYRWVSGNASRTGKVYFTDCERMGTEKGRTVSFCNTINEDRYSVESPDGITPKGKASVFMKYADTNISAAVCKEGEGYKTVCLGFPLETLEDNSDIENIISLTLEYFSK